MDFDPCPDCDPMKGTVATTLPEGWRQMSDARRDYLTSVKCGCGRVLKYAGTRRILASEPMAKYGFKWAT